MLRLLLDTCVWLDMAKDHRQKTFLDTFGYMAGGGFIGIIVPRLVVDEFARNKERIVHESGQSLIATLKRAREAVETLGNKRRKTTTVKELGDLEYQIQHSKTLASDAIEIIERLFANATIVETTDDHKLRASGRALVQTAPFHRQKNSINDAILIEIYADEVARLAVNDRLAFVTHNVKDFSEVVGDHRKPHADIAPLFASPSSTYSINLVDMLQSEELDAFKGFQDFAADFEPRSRSEILAMEHELVDKIWYDRHMLRQQLIDEGKITLVKELPGGCYKPQLIKSEIWNGARKAASRVRKQYGLKNLGPYDKFEWGMLNGKLSALRWVLGDDWDSLDT
jgi:hypothetical protein